MKNLISIIEVIIIIIFLLYTYYTNTQTPDRLFFLLLEFSAVSIYHLYEKFKNKIL